MLIKTISKQQIVAMKFDRVRSQMRSVPGLGHKVATYCFELHSYPTFECAKSAQLPAWVVIVAGEVQSNSITVTSRFGKWVALLEQFIDEQQVLSK